MQEKDITEKLVKTLKEERNLSVNGIYYFTQTDLSYNSNRIEGSRLSHQQTVFLFEKNKIYPEGNEPINTDDITETVNHFRAFDFLLDNIYSPLSESFIKQIHFILKNNTSDIEKGYPIGDYKKYANIIGETETVKPEITGYAVRELLDRYNSLTTVSLDDILDFHVRFERIHPFQDGNGRAGRLIMFRECLKNGIVPVLIYDEMKAFYYRGIREWDNEKGYLRDTALTGQDAYREKLEYFGIINDEKSKIGKIEREKS